MGKCANRLVGFDKIVVMIRVEGKKASTLILFSWSEPLAKPVCWIELRYGWGLKGMLVAQTGNPKLLRQTKDVILAEAERKAEISRQVDSVLGLIEEQELTKVRRILEVLIPKGGEGEQ